MKIPIGLGYEMNEEEVSFAHATFPFLFGRYNLGNGNCQLMFWDNNPIKNKEKKGKHDNKNKRALQQD